MRRGIVWLLSGLSSFSGCGVSPPGLARTVGVDGGSDRSQDSSIDTAAVRILIEPSDDASALVAAISAAKKSVYMTMYFFDNALAIHALEAQKSAGHDVRVVLNQRFVDDGASNTRVYDELSAAGIAVAWAPSAFRLTHEKCVILDGEEAWIMTMNVDQSSAKDNREYLAVDTDPSDVHEAETIFEADFAGAPAFVDGRLVVSPVNSRAKLLALIGNARSSIALEGEELSDQELVSALTAAAARAVNVKVVLSDAPPSAAQTDAVTVLAGAHVPVSIVSHPYIHAKAIVVDGVAAYVGSENFTAASLDDNRELGLLFDAPTEVKKVAGTILADFANGTAK